MSLTPNVVGLDRYEREQERADLAAEARAEAEMEDEAFDQADEAQWRYDRDEDYLRERADVERHGGVW